MISILGHKMAFCIVMCVTSGDGYEKGVLYPAMGWNNGIHVLRETKYGDIYDGIFHNGGNGKGDINDPDDTGAPSFDVFEIPERCGRLIDADAFEKRFHLAGKPEDGEPMKDFEDGVLTALEMLKTQPAVIKAEDE